ncbi:uncharacterized protein LOC129575126 [Sitodiplosis mosellana]|uniref:uncharacterized protein LOC129575126 n=1 Tax=Sitodiplosis mosellana TaxID=263140 RepID=UPI002444EB1B|nr:uncharacterized protein LOC129575126 [Sitodiplosis mosellana]
MLIKFLNISKSLSRPISFSFIRVYCRYSNENEVNSPKTADGHESKLIRVLNNCNNWNSLKPVLTEKKFNLIQKFKIENGGSITKFDEILQIKGISVKTVDDLRRFCESQIQENPKNASSTDIPSSSADIPLIHEHADIQPHSFVNNDSSFIFYDEGVPPIDLYPTATKSTQLISNPDNSTKKWKSLKLILEPRLTKYSSIRSFTSIYQDATGVTCTEFSPIKGEWDNGVEINSWDHHRVDSVGVKHVFQLCDQLSQVVEKLPVSDIYIMDDHIKLQHFRKAVTPKRLAEIIQMSQQFAILVTLLQNRKNSHDCTELTQSNVFSMNYSIVARLYDLFVGREPIATENIIRNLLYNSNKSPEQSPDLLAIELDDNTKKIFLKSYPVDRECLGKSMLMGLTFIRLGLLKTNK